ncbi:MAG: helix-turn-helix domain-containing protein [Meiothermus sp.]|nr:helix-turn-helix domain-containing protein [Meiothermus sp.]
MPKTEKIEAAAFDLEGAVQYTGLSHNTIRKLVQQGEIRSRKIGSRWLFSKAALDEFLGNVEAKKAPAGQAGASGVAA